MDLYISSLSFRTNEIIRVLTIVSVIFMPLTFLAGVYGMNFNAGLPLNMPELNWHFGYLFFWVVCGVLAVAMLIFFKKKNWL
jgi:magnesium transporter